jgi:hypothetical protein
VTSGDQIESLLANPTTMYLDHRLVGLGLGRRERERGCNVVVVPSWNKNTSQHIYNNFQAKLWNDDLLKH